MPRILLIITLFAILHPIYAQYRNDFFFTEPDARTERVPIKLHNNLIVISLKINGSDTLNFILDTGVRTTLITDLELCNKLDLTYGRKTKIRGLGEGESVEVLHSFNNTIEVGSVRALYQNVFIMLNFDFSLSEKLGIPIHGIIGYDIFKDMVIEIDYLKKELTMHNPKYAATRQFGTKNAIPIVLENFKPYITASISYGDTTEIPVKLLVDMGASDAIWLLQNPRKQIHIPHPSVQSFLGNGINGEINGHLARLALLRIGRFRFRDIITAFPDSLSITDSTMYSSRDGSIGAEVLRRFKVVIDYPNKRMMLYPNKDFSHKFTYNRVGFEVDKPMPSLPFFEVSQIYKSSPAAKAGVQAGDQLIAISYRNVFSLSLHDINLMLRSQKGKKMRIKIIRDGKPLVIDIPLGESI